jgi:signal transduction histidine kinase
VGRCENDFVEVCLLTMSISHNSLPFPTAPGGKFGALSKLGLSLVLGVIALSLVFALTLPKSYGLAWFGDTLQNILLTAFVALSFQNVMRSGGATRGFWMMIFFGAAIWLSSQLVWSVYELGFRVPVPDLPVADFLLIAKLVPLSAAALLTPQKNQDSRFRAFGLLDLSILILYSLYLFAFFVYAYHLLPGALNSYNSRFNVADSIGNFILAVVTGIAFFRERGRWHAVFFPFFFASVSYGAASTWNDVAIDQGRYYTGSLYDLPLVAGMAGYVWMCLAGRPLLQSEEMPSEAEPFEAKSSRRFRFLFSHLAMLVTFSTPAIGLWLLTTQSRADRLFSFRLELTLITIFLLTLLLSIKQDLLSVSLVGSLQHLSRTYSSIDRFKHHLVQSEKLATLGELVASVANQISDAMTRIREQSARITSDSTDPRTSSLASKIGLYAQRTDSLAENMQRFAQETPLQLASVEVKPLLETSLHLSRIGKLPDLRVELQEELPSPPVLADSSQLLHVFLQIISNAMDALQEVGGGVLHISIRPCEPQVCIQFADTGPGISHPERVFEPFFTTKPVGKGTGLGLSTCYGIIRQHNGDITCGNRLEGGAFFTIFLPAAFPSSQALEKSVSLAMEGTQ